MIRLNAQVVAAQMTLELMHTAARMTSTVLRLRRTVLTFSQLNRFTDSQTDHHGIVGHHIPLCPFPGNVAALCVMRMVTHGAAL